MKKTIFPKSTVARLLIYVFLRNQIVKKKKKKNKNAYVKFRIDV